jgi:3-oxoacyl-[acyl-carrier protein] reductase
MTDCVVVTGAGRGIGRATALAFAHRGFDVALLARSVEEVERVGGEIIALGRRALALRCDVSSSHEVEHARGRTQDELGTPVVVVNNAGIVRRSLIHETNDADWDAVIATNLRGPFAVTRAYLPAMLAAKRGRIIVVSSISATLGTARQASYCASKWGAVGFMKSLAEELRGTGLATMAVLPGSVDTQMLEGSGFAAQMSADDVARLVVYAALDAPAAMNGSAIEMFGP